MAELSPHTLTVSDDTGHTLIFDTAAIGAAIRAKALEFLAGDMSHETQLKRALVSTFLRTGQGMVQEMARAIAPHAPAEAFARAKGQDIMEWFAGVVAALATYGLPTQSPMRLQTVEGETDGEGRGDEPHARLVVAVALATSAEPTASSATDSRTVAARTAI